MKAFSLSFQLEGIKRRKGQENLQEIERRGGLWGPDSLKTPFSNLKEE